MRLYGHQLSESQYSDPHQITQFSLFLDNINYISCVVIENINRRIRHAIYNSNDNVWICIEYTFINFNKNSFHFTVKIAKVISQYKRYTILNMKWDTTTLFFFYIYWHWNNHWDHKIVPCCHLFRFLRVQWMKTWNPKSLHTTPIHHSA